MEADSLVEKTVNYLCVNNCGGIARLMFTISKDNAVTDGSHVEQTVAYSWNSETSDSDVNERLVPFVYGEVSANGVE